MKNYKFLSLLILLSIPLTVFSQSHNKDEDLGTFLKSKHYIPIQLNKLSTGHLYLSAQLNDSTALFILDTGAGITVVDKKFESKFSLNSSDLETIATGAGGTNIELSESIAKNFNLGDYHLNDFQIHLMSLDHVNNAFKKLGVIEVDGVIGADILSKGKAIIDYNNLILYLQP